MNFKKSKTDKLTTQESTPKALSEQEANTQVKEKSLNIGVGAVVTLLSLSKHCLINNSKELNLKSSDYAFAWSLINKLEEVLSEDESE